MSKNCDYWTQCCSGHYQYHQKYISNETLQLIRPRISWVYPVVQKNCFLTLKKLAYQNIYLIRYHKATIYTTLSQLRMLKFFTAEQDVFKYSYSPYSILEWKKLDMQIRRSESFWFFKNSLLKIGWQIAKPTYNSPLEHS